MATSNGASHGVLSRGGSIFGLQPLTRLEQINCADEPPASVPFDFSPEKIKAAVARDTALLSGAHNTSHLVGSA